MAGRINDADIAAIRDAAPIEDIVAQYVTLKTAGSGTLKGLCPFHDERSASFHVTPARGMWYCFGCSEGGDVLSFLQKIEHIGFPEAVERLAERTGITLRHLDDDPEAAASRGQRSRLLAAHRDAETFYQRQLGAPESAPAVTFLRDRGFNRAAAEHFGIGYAPKGWDALSRHLRAKGHTEEDLITGGLSARSARGTLIDKFRGRLIWPIRNAAGETIGFGARRLYDEDTGPKYLNTSDTPLYSKSHVLYGLDLARKPIAATKSVVVVEGYTDVMACHLAGLTTAVAACGTAFGPEHVAIVRRLLADDSGTGEVTFTFDGDAAGQKAALRAFGEESRFVARTYVAVAPEGKDPCEIRMSAGDQGVRDLLASRVPLFEFVITTAIASHDLASPEGRIAALRHVAPIVAGIKDPALRPEYTRLVSGWLGVDLAAAHTEISRAATDTPRPAATSTAAAGRDPQARLEREALKAVLHDPAAVATWYEAVEDSAYTVAEHHALHRVLTQIHLPSATTDSVLAAVATSANEATAALARTLAAEPVMADPAYLTATVARLIDADATRRITAIRSQMQRSADPAEQSRLLTDLTALERYRRDLAATATG